MIIICATDAERDMLLAADAVTNRLENGLYVLSVAKEMIAVVSLESRSKGLDWCRHLSVELRRRVAVAAMFPSPQLRQKLVNT